MQINIQVSTDGVWKTIVEASLVQKSEEVWSKQGHFLTEKMPDYIECTFHVEDLPEFTVTPVATRANIMTGNIKIQGRLYYITIVPDKDGYNYNAGCLIDENMDNVMEIIDRTKEEHFEEGRETGLDE